MGEACQLKFMLAIVSGTMLLTIIWISFSPWATLIPENFFVYSNSRPSPKPHLSPSSYKLIPIPLPSHKPVPTPLPPNPPPPECRLIFSLNSGHAGSGHLANILKGIPNINVGHEREPDMSQEMVLDIRKHGLVKTFDKRVRLKIPPIQKVIDRGQIYGETSHLFMTSFYDVVLRKFYPKCQFDLIVLRRPIQEIVRSYALRIQRDIERGWLHIPGVSPQASIQGIPRFYDSLNATFALILEIEAKAQTLSQTYPWIRMVDACLNDIRNVKGIRELYFRMGEKQPSRRTIRSLCHGIPVLFTNSSRCSLINKHNHQQSTQIKEMSDKEIQRKFIKFRDSLKKEYPKATNIPSVLNECLLRDSS